MKESKVDVLVIGAGPAGLMAAYALAKAGVNVRVIDKRCVVQIRSYSDCTEFRFINETRQYYGWSSRWTPTADS